MVAAAAPGDKSGKIRLAGTHFSDFFNALLTVLAGEACTEICLREDQ
jgi:hypothetical protein